MGIAGADPVEIASRLVVRRADPLNCEVRLVDLNDGLLVPSSHFYVRSHFPEPDLDPGSWRLRIRGLVLRETTLSLEQLFAMPSRSMPVTLECAGNGRAMLRPPVEGEQWQLGAVGTAEWTGVPLAELMKRAGVFPDARHIVFRGADAGEPASGVGIIRYERSLSLIDARESRVLLAYAMNGQPLSRRHGYPLRAIVPGWYGVASVKWLTELELIGDDFSGYYQTHKYVYESLRDGRLEREPVRLQRVRALITSPLTGDTIPAGRLRVAGLAWSGSAPVARVEVDLGGGSWREARLVGRAKPYCWQRWELANDPARTGAVRIRARATDALGQRQPEQAFWNRLGYGNNAVQEVVVRAV